MDGPITQHLRVDLTPEWCDFLNQMLKETNLTVDGLFILAFGLLRLALDAKAEGKAVGSSDSPEVLDTEFEI